MGLGLLKQMSTDGTQPCIYRSASNYEHIRLAGCNRKCNPVDECGILVKGKVCAKQNKAEKIR